MKNWNLVGRRIGNLEVGKKRGRFDARRQRRDPSWCAEVLELRCTPTDCFAGTSSANVPNPVLDPRGQGTEQVTDGEDLLFTPDASGTATFMFDSGVYTDVAIWNFGSNTYLGGEADTLDGNFSYSVTAGTEYRLCVDPIFYNDTPVAFNLPDPNPITVSLDSNGDASITGNAINPSTDGDYFKYTSPAAGTLSIVADGSLGQFDTDLFVYNVAYSLLCSDTGGFDDGDCSISVSASNVVLYILVRGDITDYGSDSTGSYSLSINGPGVPPPEVYLSGNGANIVDGDTTPSTSDCTNLGSAQQGQTGPICTYTVRNDGSQTLTLGGVSVPTGFTLAESLVSSLSPGGSDTFTVRLDTSSSGTKSGQVSFTTNDSDENPFNFAITGVVTPPPQEIYVSGNSVSITDGDSTPTTTDGTDFGTVLIGQSGPTHSFTVRNDGGQTLTLGTVSVPTGYTLTEALSSSLSPGASDSFTVRLDTATTGTKSGQISFSNNDSDENPFNFSVTAVVTTPPEIYVSGNGVSIVDGDTTPSATGGTDFGSAQELSIGPSHTFTVRNDGGSTLTLGTPSLPAGYFISEGLNSTLAPGASDSFSVQLQTGSIGVISGQVSISTNDSDENPFNFQITGTITARSQELEGSYNGTLIVDGDSTPTPLEGTDFGSVQQGQTGPSRVFTVRNTGGLTLTLGSVSVPSGFTLVNGLVTSLAPDASDDFTIQLNTGSSGTFSGQVSFSSNDGDENPFNFQITGTVTPPPQVPEIYVSGNSVSISDGDTTPTTSDGTDFGSVLQGQVGLTRTFTVRNDGTAALTLGLPTLPSGYSLSESLVTSLATGAQDMFTVVLNTGTAGTFSGQISISNNDSNENPFNFSITGTVNSTAPEIFVSGIGVAISDGDTSPSASDGTDFGSVQQGQTSPIRTFLVRNDGNATLTLSAPSLPTGYSLTEPLVTSLAAGAQDTFTVTLSSATQGSFTGQISISNNDGNENPFNFSITGMVSSLPPTVTVSATDSTAAEQGQATGLITVSRTGSTATALTVQLSLAGSTATSASDYNSIGTSVTIPAGSTTATITVTPIDDTTGGESNETVVVTLVAGTGYSVGIASSATVTIADNDLRIANDFNGDAQADSFYLDKKYGNLVVSIANGQSRTYSTGLKPIGSVVADFNRDGIWDIAVINKKSKNLKIFLGNSDGTFQSGNSYSVLWSGKLMSPWSIALDDFDGDGNKDDLRIWNKKGTKFVTFLGNGDGTFNPA